MEVKTMNEDTGSKKRRCLCEPSRRINIFIFGFALLNLAITFYLLYMQLNQKVRLQKIDKELGDCQRNIEYLRSYHVELAQNENKKRKISRKSNLPGKRKESIQKSASQKVVNPNKKISCPFRSSKRRKICLFINREVSKQLLSTLRKEIKKALRELPSYYFHFPGKDQRNLSHASRMITARSDTYSLEWDTASRNCRTPQHLSWCRLTRRSNECAPQMDAANFKVPVAGYYLVYAQLNIKVNRRRNSRSIAHLLSKASILMTMDPSGGHTASHELISGNPVMATNGKAVTFSLFTQVYLFKNSHISVAVTTRGNVAVPREGMELILDKKETKNAFGMFLLREADDSDRGCVKRSVGR